MVAVRSAKANPHKPRKGQPWLASEIRFVRENFQHKTNEAMSIDLERTVESIKSVMARLGLVRTRGKFL